MSAPSAGRCWCPASEPRADARRRWVASAGRDPVSCCLRCHARYCAPDPTPRRCGRRREDARRGGIPGMSAMTWRRPPMRGARLKRTLRRSRQEPRQQNDGHDAGDCEHPEQYQGGQLAAVACAVDDLLERGIRGGLSEDVVARDRRRLEDRVLPPCEKSSVADVVGKAGESPGSMRPANSSDGAAPATGNRRGIHSMFGEHVQRRPYCDIVAERDSRMG